MARRDLASIKFWQVGHGRRIELGHRSRIMGILNVTPDSFSDGGRHLSLDAAVAHARSMQAAGADIIDIGGESTRPGAEPVSAEVEQARILPVIEALAPSGMILSVDTYRAATARLAVAAGAHIVNDVWGAQREPEIAAVAAETGAGLCLMHTSRDREVLPDVLEDQKQFLRRSIEIARNAGVRDEAVALDPGFGFGKVAAINFEIMDRFEDLIDAFDRPFLVGTSRKRFVRRAVGEAGNVDLATAATSVILRGKGAALFRVHDVAGNRDALAVIDAMRAVSGDLSE